MKNSYKKDLLISQAEISIAEVYLKLWDTSGFDPPRVHFFHTTTDYMSGLLLKAFQYQDNFITRHTTVTVT